MREAFGKRLGAEDGFSIVLLAFFLPVLVLLTGLAIDTANWWVHKRHLQTQADAAALAGAGLFRFPCDEARNALIERTAVEYSGGADLDDNPTIAPIYNKQVGRERPDIAAHEPVNTLGVGAPVHTRINEAQFWERATITDTDIPADGTGTPCAQKFVDVKMTEERAYGFFGRVLPEFMTDALSSLTPAFTDHIDAQARVELKRINAFQGLVPLGIEEVAPEHVHVWLFDEEDPANDASQPALADAALKPAGESGGLLRFDNSMATEGALPELVPNITQRRIGVTVALSGDEGTPIPDGADFNTTCELQFVLCYGTPSRGLTRIRGYRTTGTAPRVERVKVDPAGTACRTSDNGYFSTGCDKVQVTPTVVFPTGTTATLAVSFDANDKKPTALAADGTAVLTMVPGSGTKRVTVFQTSGTLAGKDCSKQPCPLEQDAHAAFAGSREAGSGPIKELSVTRIDPLTGPENGNNVVRCALPDATNPSPQLCPHTFVFSLAVGGNLGISDPGADPIVMRNFKADNASTANALTGSLDCDFTNPPGIRTIRQEFAQGCLREYRRRTTTDPECPLHANALEPWPATLYCVPVDTGNPEQAQDGLTRRILCTPPSSPSSNCTENPNAGNVKAETCTNPEAWNDGAYTQGDPRLIPVFLVPFGSFNPLTNEIGGGQGPLPIIDFAFFYVTAWDGDPKTNPCATTDNPPDAKRGDIWGHFVRYIGPNLGGGATEDCPLDNPESISGCQAVMTK